MSGWEVQTYFFSGISEMCFTRYSALCYWGGSSLDLWSFKVSQSSFFLVEFLGGRLWKKSFEWQGWLEGPGNKSQAVPFTKK